MKLLIQEPLRSHHIAFSVVAGLFFTSSFAFAQNTIQSTTTTIYKIIPIAKSFTQDVGQASNTTDAPDSPTPPVLDQSTGARVLVRRGYIPPGYPIVNNPKPTLRALSATANCNTNPAFAAASDCQTVIVQGHYICSTDDGWRIYSEHCGWPWPFENGDGGGTTTPNPGGGGSHSTTPVNTKPQAKESCQSVLPKQDRSDSSYVFSAWHEGAPQTRGKLFKILDYPNAGMTIGAGVDLGARTKAELTSWGMSAAGLKAVGPYLGAKNKEAHETLREMKGKYPVISEDDAKKISDGAFQSILSKTSSDYDAVQTAGASFQELPAAAQVVIMDIAYIGKPSTLAPSFWSAITSGRWSDAADELANWYANKTNDKRHLDDAKKLSDAILAKELPEKSSGKCK